MKSDLAPCRYSSVHVIVDFDFSFSGSCSWLMSECMSTMNRSMRPSLSKSKNLIPIAPHGVLGKSRSVFSTLSSSLVLVVMAVPLHVQEENVGPAVSIHLG